MPTGFIPQWCAVYFYILLPHGLIICSDLELLNFHCQFLKFKLCISLSVMVNRRANIILFLPLCHSQTTNHPVKIFPTLCLPIRKETRRATSKHKIIRNKWTSFHYFSKNNGSRYYFRFSLHSHVTLKYKQKIYFILSPRYTDILCVWINLCHIYNPNRLIS